MDLFHVPWNDIERTITIIIPLPLLLLIIIIIIIVITVSDICLSGRQIYCIIDECIDG